MNTNIFEAIQNGDLDEIEYFFDQGGDVNIEDEFGDSLLENAYQFDQMGAFELLRDKGADVKYFILKNNYEIKQKIYKYKYLEELINKI